MGTRRVRLAANMAVLTALALVPSVGGPAAAGFAGFTMSADGCRGVSANFVLPLSRAQAVVPAPYKVYDYAGLGWTRGTIRITRCDRLRIDGGPASPAIFSSVLIDLNPPKAPGTSAHYYELWRLDARSELRQRFATAGMAGDHLDKLALEALSPGPLFVTQAAAPWPRSSYSMVVATPDPTPGFSAVANESTWHKGPLGTFRTYTSNVEAQHAGTATLSASADVASLVGLPAAALPAFLRVFSFTAKVEAVQI